ncbi:MAG: division/cell wall cluster transcriptional repressor MraZ [Defluviicoccus sp.]|nr:division/cell wall cluster transcriptional repressor MraZ [Defluviicoccus sp.]
MTAFLSTYVNKVDRKKRVSVPAPFRAALAGSSFGGLIVYPSLRESAIEAFSRDVLEQLNNRRMSRSLEGDDFEQLLLGGGDGLIDAVMAMVHELPFDPEGRVVLPSALAAHAGITDRAAFVGRGNRFQIWAPEAFQAHQDEAIDALRRRAGNGDGP